MVAGFLIDNLEDSKTGGEIEDGNKILAPQRDLFPLEASNVKAKFRDSSVTIHPLAIDDVLQIVTVFMKPHLIQRSTHPAVTNFYKLDDEGGFLDYGSNSLAPALIAADLSKCVA